MYNRQGMVDTLLASIRAARRAPLPARIVQYAEERCQPQLEFLGDYVRIYTP